MPWQKRLTKRAEEVVMPSEVNVNLKVETPELKRLSTCHAIF